MTIEKDLNRIATALEQIAVALTTKKDIIIPESEKKPDIEPVQETVQETPEALKPTDNPPPVITHEELHDLCLSLVRKDRAKKNKIKAILAARNAELIKDVPEDQFAALKAELEAL